jgi:penicillin amidase
MVERTSTRARPEYLLFQSVLSHLLTALYAPIVPANGPARAQVEKDFLQFDPVFPSLGVKIAATALASASDSPVLGGRVPRDLLSQALSDGLDEATAKFGPDPATWAAPATPHVFSINNYAGVVESTDPQPPSLPVHMNRGTENDRIVFKEGRVSYCDVTPPGQSSFIAPDGSRGPHYDDQLTTYQAFACKPQWLTPAEVTEHARSVERLLPP